MEMQEDLGEWAVAEVLYESSLKHFGVPVELRLFDPQFSENLNEAWLAQVGASRGRSEIAIVTSDREQLRESLGISSARPSATELAREQAHLPQPEHRIQQAPAQQIEPPGTRNEISMSHSIGLGL